MTWFLKADGTARQVALSHVATSVNLGGTVYRRVPAHVHGRFSVVFLESGAPYDFRMRVLAKDLVKRSVRAERPAPRRVFVSPDPGPPAAGAAALLAVAA